MTIGAVIVTYNRLEKLKKCLESYEAQSHPPHCVLVIDNASTDGTKEFLDRWAADTSEAGIKRMLVHSPENRGGAGGFSEGLRLMANQEVDWIWVADDDAYPMPQCLENISSFYGSLPEREAERTAAIAAKVIGRDGEISLLHRRRLKCSWLWMKEVPLGEEQIQAPAEIDIFSFVGVAIKKKAVHRAGLPEASYFIYFDDSEYALRMKRAGTCLCLPDAVILHDSKEAEIVKYSWKNYYMFRNKLYMYKRHFPARYYYTEICRLVFMILRYYNCVASWKQFGRAVADAQRDRMGPDARYQP